MVGDDDISIAVFEIKRMYVREHARGRGIGLLLLEALERHAAALGARRLLPRGRARAARGDRALRAGRL